MTIQLVRPCRGHITQMYGNIQPDGRPHTGNDYAYTDGVNVFPEILAAASGTVLYVGDSRKLGWPNPWYFNPDFDRTDAWDSSAGNVIVLGHTQGLVRFVTTYSHVESWTVKAGDTVRAVQRIGTIGNTGNSYGKHLHFELLLKPFNFGTSTFGRTDPNPYIDSGSIGPQGSITPSEEDDVALTDKQAQALDFLAEHGGRMKQILEAVDERTGNSETGTLKKAADLVLEKINPTNWPDGKPMYIAAQADIDGLHAAIRASEPAKYFRGTGEDKTVYQNVDGVLRSLTYDEWVIEQAKGERFADIDPKWIDKLKEEGA